MLKVNHQHFKNQKILHFVKLQSNEKFSIFHDLDYVIKKCLQKNHEIEKNFVKYSQYKEQDRIKFAKNKRFKNNKTGEIIKIKNKTLLEELTQQYQTTQFAIQQLDFENKDKELIFLTMTLPPRFHSKIKNKSNIAFGIDKIKEGYKVLNEAQRQIQKDLSKAKIEYKFIRVIEPHKDNTPHQHIQYWVSDQKRAMKVIKNTIKNKIKGKLLGKQFDIVALQRQDGKNVSGYITKYMTKLISDLESNEQLLYKFDGWKRKAKIRMFSNSNVSIPKSLYNHIVSVAPDNLDKKDYENLGVYALKHIKYIAVVDNKTKIKHNPKNDTKFTFRVVKETYEAPNISVRKFPKMYYKLLADLIYGNNIPIDTIKRYKRISLQVFDENFKKIRDSKDWSIIEVQEEENIIPQAQSHDLQFYELEMWGIESAANNSYYERANIVNAYYDSG